MPGFANSTTGSPLTETYLDDYVNAQVVMRYASAAARDADALLTASIREGMVCYLVDTDVIAYYNGTAWVESHRGTARRVWAPILQQSAIVTYTTTTGATNYAKEGREVRAAFNLGVTSAGSAGTDIALELPFTAPSTWIGNVIGNGWIYDASATVAYYAQMIVFSTTYAKFLYTNTGAQAYVGGTGASFALASGDVARGQIAYEAAS